MTVGSFLDALAFTNKARPNQVRQKWPIDEMAKCGVRLEEVLLQLEIARLLRVQAHQQGTVHTQHAQRERE